METEIRTCACGKQFEAPINRDFKFCSHECSCKLGEWKTAFKDLTGQKFNMLTVVRTATDEEKKDLPEKSRSKKYVICNCDCGKQNVLAASGDLKYGSIKSCGCARIKKPVQTYVCEVCKKSFEAAPYAGRLHRTCSNECKMQLANDFKKRDDYIGQKFNKLTVVAVDESKSEERRTDLLKHLFVVCKCDCGNTLSIDINCLKAGQISCGCHLPEKIEKNVYQTSFNRVYSSYKRGAQARSLAFNLTEDQFRETVSKPCHYCGALPNTEGCHCKHTDFQEKAFPYTGVDRVCNDRGYEMDNCVPCCKTCNMTKHSHDYVQYLQTVKATYENLKLNLPDTIKLPTHVEKPVESPPV